MPPDGYTTITINEDVLSLLTEVVIEYDCDSIADTVETASTVALGRNEAEVAQRLADRLSE